MAAAVQEAGSEPRRTRGAALDKCPTPMQAGLDPDQRFAEWRKRAPGAAEKTTGRFRHVVSSQTSYASPPAEYCTTS